MATDIFTQIVSHEEPMTALGRLAGAGYIHHKTGYLPWRVLGRYALVYVLEGTGKYQDANGLASEIEPGSLMLLFPELAHRYGPGVTGTWAEFHVIFEGKPFDDWREAGVLDSRQPIYRLAPVEDWQTRLVGMIGDGQTVGTVSVARLLALLTEAAATRDTRVTSAERHPWIGKAQFLLMTELNQEKPMAEIARHLGVSYETFRKVFEQQTGVSPARYRASKRLEAARALLLHTDMTCRQIADSLGYPDEFYFSKRFKQFAGLSPRTFRRASEPCDR
jgi:AraC-like DNA-binding protein